MKHTPLKIGFLQAVGIVLYVTLFALSVDILQIWFPNGIKMSPFANILLFLLTFIVSATICSGLMFGYPIFLFTRGKHAEAIRTFSWALGWLALFLLVFGVVAFLFLRS